MNDYSLENEYRRAKTTWARAEQDKTMPIAMRHYHRGYAAAMAWVFHNRSALLKSERASRYLFGLTASNITDKDLDNLRDILR